MFRVFSYIAALFVAKLNSLSIAALKSKTALSDLISKSRRLIFCPLAFLSIMFSYILSSSLSILLHAIN